QEQDEPKAAARIRSPEHGDTAALSSRDDDGCSELPEPQIERALANRRPATQPLDIRAGILAERPEAVLLRPQADDVVAGRGNPDALAERQERRREHEDDRRQDESHPRRAVSNAPRGRRASSGPGRR